MDCPLGRSRAVRSLGRLELPALLSDIAPLLADPEPVVRAEAANAVAQSVRGADASEARRLLKEAGVKAYYAVVAAGGGVCGVAVECAGWGGVRRQRGKGWRV